MMSTAVRLAEDVSWDALQVVINGLANKAGVKAYGLATGGADTRLSYAVYTDAKLTKARQAWCEAFVAGICYSR